MLHIYIYTYKSLEPSEIRAEVDEPSEFRAEVDEAQLHYIYIYIYIYIYYIY